MGFHSFYYYVIEIHSEPYKLFCIILFIKYICVYIVEIKIIILLKVALNVIVPYIVQEYVHEMN